MMFRVLTELIDFVFHLIRFARNSKPTVLGLWLETLAIKHHTPTRTIYGLAMMTSNL